MSTDVLRHGAGDERLVASVWLPRQQALSRGLCGQSQGGEGVHDQVDPQHLHGLQGRVLQKKQNGETQSRNSEAIT